MIQIGYFGKTPHRGDFVRFNLPKAFVTVMDDWLQSMMILGESTHAEQWASTYQACPGYRFHLSPDIAGEHAWSGVIGASTDKVGRRFPFCIAACLPEMYPPPWNQASLETSMVLLQSLLLKTADPDYDFDAIQTELEDIAHHFSQAIDSFSDNRIVRADTPSPDRFSLLTSITHVSHDSNVSASLLDSLLRQAYFNYSAWIPLKNASAHKGLLSNGLPQEQQALALFDTRWENLHIDELQTIDTGLPSAELLPQHAQQQLVTDQTTQACDDMVEPTTEVPIDADLPIDATQTQQSKAAPVSTVLPLKPTVEPLELDEDSSTTAPWD